MLNADFSEPTKPLPLPCLEKLKRSPREVLHQAGKRLVKPRCRRSGPGGRRFGSRSEPPSSAQLLLWVLPTWTRPRELTSPRLCLDIQRLVTVFITVEYFLAFLPCPRFPLSLSFALVYKSLEGATWCLPGAGKAPLGKGLKEVLEA